MVNTSKYEELLKSAPPGLRIQTREDKAAKVMRMKIVDHAVFETPLTGDRQTDWDALVTQLETWIQNPSKETAGPEKDTVKLKSSE